MRILVASDQWFPDFRGGSARVATETARRLAARGHELTVLTAGAGGGEGVEREGTLEVRRVLPRGRLPQTLTDVAASRRHARRLGTSSFDVLLAHQSTTAAGLLAAAPHTPLALVFHASSARERLFLRERGGLSRGAVAAYGLVPFLRRLEARAAHAAERILVLSDFSRRLLEEDHGAAVGAKVVTVGGGVDVERFAPADGAGAARRRLGLSVEGPLLVTVRRLEPRMGLEELVRALARPEVQATAALAIVGGGSAEGRLRQLVAELGLGSRVRFAGRVGDDELPDWYRAGDLFVLPTVAYEGFGMVTAEALASGTPVVGTPVGATPELLEGLEPSLLAEHADAGSLAAAISRGLALAGPGLAERARAYAVERFGWDAVVARWEAALELAAAGRRRAEAATVR